MTDIREVRVSRICPSCYVRAKHRGNADGVKHQIACVRCGHSWRGVVLKTELT